MEVAIGLVDVTFKLLNHLRRSYKPSKSKELRRDIKFILRELRSIQDAMRKRHGMADDGIRCWIADLNEIRERIKDTVEFHNLKVVCRHHNPGAFRKLLHRVRTRSACKKLLLYIGEIKQLVVEAKVRAENYKLPQADNQTTFQNNRPYQHANEAHPVGLETLKEELIPLLSRCDGSASRRRVLAISGTGGSGKTVLAKELYRLVQQEFDCMACVTASNDVGKVLSDLCDKFGVQTPSTSEDLSEHLREYLQNKRYIIIVDDLQTSVWWHVILHACPDNDMGSRIILTTTNEEIARSCHENCRGHKMQPLDEDSARDLLLQKVFGEDKCPNSFRKCLPMILKTCEYLPLLIVNMADYIRSRESWDSDTCVQVCKNIGSLLVNMDNEAFVGMNQVFNRSYNSLNHNARICLLSLIIYPKDHAIKRKNIIRQWLAHGLIRFNDNRPEQEVANECLSALVDHHFILPKKVSICGQVKSFQVRQIMLEFIKDKGNSENFVTWIDTHVRSLKLSGQESKVLLDFRDCKFLRKVDLENCEGLTNQNLNYVCRLLLLKYLSIRGSKGVTKLPRNIVKLLCLRVLDTRDTKVDIISMEVILLPELAELFGKFKITCSKRNLKKFFSKKNCNLHTLSGLFYDESQCFIKLLPHMRRLSKVKILCRQIAPGNEVKTDLLLSLKRCFERELSEPNLPLQSLSIDFGDLCDLDFLDNLEVPSDCLLRCLKLRGKLTRLPSFIQSVDLIKLCLSRTNLGVSVLSELQGLENLVCLKLTEDDPFMFEEEEFIWHSGWFVYLKYLCLIFPEVPKIVIKEKAMQGLKSLQLFCTELGGFSGIEHLLQLEEVILHPDITGGGETDLLKQVSSHPMRPKILRSAMTASN
ncbi:unnamed protein product [Urochloa humidicola]